VGNAENSVEIALKLNNHSRAQLGRLHHCDWNP
jgi:hypothetical protein